MGRRLPLRVGQFAGRQLGSFAGLVARRERVRVMANLSIAFPEWSDTQRRRTADAMFRHLGMLLFEMVWLPNINATNMYETAVVEGSDAVTAAVREGRSVVVIGSHCGNWEWLAYLLGLTAPLSVMQRERDETGLNDFIRTLRLHAGVQTIDRGTSGSGREILRALKKPGLLAFLIDQSIRAESAKVPFFGTPALTPIGPAKLAIRSGAPLLPVFIERLPNGKHRARFLDLIETKPDDDPIAVTAKLTLLIEEQIRRAPEQWVWIHDRWRDRPKWDVANRP